ncbi:MAG TPA: hypothetical protein DDY70_02345 [Clostridiales bacterium]|nr:hypothetical protein [Clostridiales bacterium]
MLFLKLLRTVKQYKAQFISMMLMIALGIGVFVGFNMEWASIEESMDSFFDETGYADFLVRSESGFSEEDRASVAAILGVRRVARYIAVNTDVKEKEGHSLSLTVTTDPAVSGFLVTSGDAYDEDSTDGIWISDQYAQKNGFSVGDTLTLIYANREFKGKIKGLIKSGEYMICTRDESQLMPDLSTYAFAYISPAFYRGALGFEFYTDLRVLSDMEKAEFSEAVKDAVGKTLLVFTKSETAAYSAAEGEVDEGKTMGSVLPVLFLLIAVLTMVTTMHRLAAKEKTQIGTLKALGYKDRRILLHYTSYAAMVGVVGLLGGIGIGYAIVMYIMDPNGMMGTYMDLPEWKIVMPPFMIPLLAVVFLLLVLIGFLSVKEMLRGTAADALRPYTPKKMKPLLIEKTKLFHKLSFGTRWNLRDIMRHKSRSAMSLIGVIGCTLLIIASLGMRDTMDAFLDLYYQGATNYASRIYLSDTATADDADTLSTRYAADRSASVYVEMTEEGEKTEKSVSLDIYDVTRDKIRFPAEKGGYTTLSEDGAYICVRLADTFGLKEGDTFTVSPYGSEKSYTVRVAGIFRSTSESIAMTPAYADTLGISYRYDSLYTDTAKAEIATDDAIKSVQEKQAIIDTFDTFLDMMNKMIFLLVGGALLLGIIVLYNLGVMSYTERYREMATLKVVGFKDRRIGELLIGQNLWLSLLGALIGLPVGVLTLDYLLKALAGEYEMRMSVSVLSILITILLTVGMSLLVSFFVARKNRKIDMVEALKGAE